MAWDEVVQFATIIGAVDMDRSISPFSRPIFSRKNYFQISSVKLIIKISRLEAPNRSFWGVGPKQIEILANAGPYYIVLLDATGKRGWAFSGAEVTELIGSLRSGWKPSYWNQGNVNDDYKISAPLPEINRFESPENLLAKIAFHNTRYEELGRCG